MCWLQKLRADHEIVVLVCRAQRAPHKVRGHIASDKRTRGDTGEIAVPENAAGHTHHSGFCEIAVMTPYERLARIPSPMLPATGWRSLFIWYFRLTTWAPCFEGQGCTRGYQPQHIIGFRRNRRGDGRMASAP